MADWFGGVDARLLAGALLAALLLAACGGGLQRLRAAEAPQAPDQVHRYGGLELVTHTRSYRLADRSGRDTTHDWALRWQGQPLTIDTLGGLFGDTPSTTGVVNAVFVIGEGEPPDLIVLVGDPNNTGAFHRLHQQDGRLSMALLCVAPGGNNSVAWVDGPDARQGTRGLYSGPQHQVLRGGRWLMLGDGCVYDVAQGQAHPVPHPPDDTSVWSSVPVLAVSPGGRRLARFGSVARGGEAMPHILVADLDGGGWSALPVDRQRMRYPTHEAVDATWLAHHFEWRRSPDGDEQLVERRGFRPLPWRGSWDSSGFNYMLESVQVDASPAIAALLVRDFQAERLPPAHPGDESLRFRVRGEVLQLTMGGFFVESGRPYFPGQPGDPALQRALVRTLGEAFDAELATGRHDTLFVAPPPGR